jgi:hypothetical protein
MREPPAGEVERLVRTGQRLGALVLCTLAMAVAVHDTDGTIDKWAVARVLVCAGAFSSGIRQLREADRKAVE